MQEFVYQARAQRVVFGVGALARLADELDRLGGRRALVLSTPEQADGARRVSEQIGTRSAGLFTQAAMHVPVTVVQAACSEVRRLDADCVVAFGGGSTTGLGKAIALETGLPVLAVPTTYAGSEMTTIYGLTDDGVKRTGRDARVLPRTVIYDPVLTLSLPLAMTVTSALNAMAHAAEALYADDGNPVLALMAEEGIRASAAALAPLRTDVQHLGARSDALYGAWLCGMALDGASMGLHHKLCHTLGGSFNLPHAETHAVMLPHVLAYNAAYAEASMQRMARALGLQSAADVPAGLFYLARRHAAPASLRELGMPADGLDRAAHLAVTTPYPNPRPLEQAPLRALLQRAFDGEVPQP